MRADRRTMSFVESTGAAMDALVATRRSLHGVAELLVAGPQFRATGTMRLAARPGGFGSSRPFEDLTRLGVYGTDLVLHRAGQELRLPLTGTYESLAAAAGLRPGGLEGAYRDGSGVRPSDPIRVDPAAGAELAAAWTTGDAALRALAAEVGQPATPVLWPEHFDVGITLDAVNYGVSPGDSAIEAPYAYVSPPDLREGPFWSQPFGAGRPLRELGDEAAVLAFFREGRTLA
ncbi:MAG TPA: hypothetical protein VEL73_08695, partial [Mycobacteriales bacterium]|nr:hypothetical protein [Mycobacteriales bacterium]